MCDIVKAKEIFEDGISFPIGLIKKGSEEVRLYFMHYHSFFEAKEKWLERGKRINYDNISVIVEIPYVPSEEIIEKFEKLPYKKVMLTDKKMLFRGENYQTLKSYKSQYPGKTFKYVHRFGVKRNFDEFDYVAFLKGVSQNATPPFWAGSKIVQIGQTEAKSRGFLRTRRRTKVLREAKFVQNAKHIIQKFVA